MTTIEYDEMTDDFFAVCHDCEGGWQSRPYAHRRNAERAADQHEELHDDGVI